MHFKPLPKPPSRDLVLHLKLTTNFRVAQQRLQHKHSLTHTQSEFEYDEILAK